MSTKPLNTDIFPAHELRAGLTLVELLVAMALGLIISGVAFSIYRINARHYLDEEAFIQQQQNLRAAFFIMGRDLRMAGNGLKVLGPDSKLAQAWTVSRPALIGGVPSINPSDGWFSLPDTATPGARAIFGIDGGTGRSDAVTIFRSEVEFPTPLGMVAAVSGSDYTMADPLPNGAVSAGDAIALVQGSSALVLTAKEIIGPTIKVSLGGPGHPPALPPSFNPSGAMVYNLREISLVTYWVDEGAHRLMAAFHDGSRQNFDDPATRSIVVADDIEDLQLYYFYETEKIDQASLSLPPQMGSAILNNMTVKAVALGMTSRSSYGRGFPSRRRPALYNRELGAAQDNRRRSSLSEYISLRNFER